MFRKSDVKTTISSLSPSLAPFQAVPAHSVRLRYAVRGSIRDHSLGYGGGLLHATTVAPVILVFVDGIGFEDLSAPRTAYVFYAVCKRFEPGASYCPGRAHEWDKASRCIRIYQNQSVRTHLETAPLLHHTPSERPHMPHNMPHNVPHNPISS